ncbi:MAG: hypothetical protein ACYS1A_13500 [Planctomycetota bacterium]|jgi:hypothetical protein
MSPNGQIRGGKVVPSDNIYTALLALAFLVVLAATIYVAWMCHVQYGTIFKIPVAN